jgi:hypothetical protein
MAEAKPSDRQLFLAAALLVVGRIGLWVSAIYAAARIIAVQPLPNRLWLIAGLSILLIFTASRLFRTPSLLWQVALQACAIAGVVLGMSMLYQAFSTGPSGLLGHSGVVGLIMLLIGAASALLLRRLQAKIKGKPSAV